MTHVTDVIIRAGQTIDRMTANRTRKLNVGPRELTALLVLADHHGITAAEVVARTGITKRVVSVMVQRMEKHGLITRSASPSHKGAKIIKLTRKGRTRIDKLRRIQRDVDKAVEKALGNHATVVEDRLKNLIESEAA